MLAVGLAPVAAIILLGTLIRRRNRKRRRNSSSNILLDKKGAPGQALDMDELPMVRLEGVPRAGGHVVPDGDGEAGQVRGVQKVMDPFANLLSVIHLSPMDYGVSQIFCALWTHGDLGGRGSDRRGARVSATHRKFEGTFWTPRTVSDAKGKILTPRCVWKE